MRPALGLAAALLIGLSGCSRNVPEPGTSPSPEVSDGIPPTLSVAAADFPAAWLAEQVGGDAVEVRRITATEVPTSPADLVVYVPGLDPAVDAAAAALPEERRVDLLEDVRQLSTPTGTKDPYVWFDPVNLAPMAATLAGALTATNGERFPRERFAVQQASNDYYGVRSLSVASRAGELDASAMDRLTSCRIEALPVDRPVLAYFARAYAFTQIPVTGRSLAKHGARAAYTTPDRRREVRQAVGRVPVVPVRDLSRSAPNGDLLDGFQTTVDAVAAHQRCPEPPAAQPLTRR